MLINDVYICTFFEFSIDKCFDTVNRAQIYKFFSNLDIFFAKNAIFLLFFPIIAIIYDTNTISLSFCQSCPHRFAFRFEQQLLGFLAVNLNWRSHELWNIVRHEPVVIECLRAFLWKHERLCHLSICRDMAEVRARELPVIAT